MIELLAPAKNYEYGVAAINAGADAVYIGAPKFGARYGATNSIDDIRRLTQYAHLFGAKVFVTLNTVLFDDELDQARVIAYSLSDVGVDALIVQDMSYLTFGLDVPLHASTQAAALTPEKVKFYQNAGFERVILERAMSLADIKAIREVTNVELEVFVHGAICVAMSGQCYMGQAVSGRSGNRGVCSQPCRSTYTLSNERGEVLVRDKHLLSLLDLNLSDYLPQLVESGVTSFKIEGRLKDISYLKNSVAYYRRAIDNIEGISRSSVGESVTTFEPNPIKTFSRRYTSYFIEGKTIVPIASFHTAKALGEMMGSVLGVSTNSFTMRCGAEFSGGDGICFIDGDGRFGGTNINSACRVGEVVTIYPNVMDGIVVGATIYRNSDKKYVDEVTSAKVTRQIATRIDLFFGERSYIKATDTTGESVTLYIDEALEIATNSVRAQETLKKQLSRSGDTIFRITEVSIEGDVPFMAVSRINSLRRELLEMLTDSRLAHYKRNTAHPLIYPAPYAKELDYKANVTNGLARQFYEKCGFERIEEGVECRGNVDGVELMTTRYCIRKEIGECLKDGGRHKELYINDGANSFKLHFDCGECRMKIMANNKKNR